MRGETLSFFVRNAIVEIVIVIEIENEIEIEVEFEIVVGIKCMITGNVFTI